MSTKTCNISETVQDRTKITMTNWYRKSHTRFRLDDIERPICTVVEKMRFKEPTRKKWTRMRGKAQPDGRPALQIIETPFLLFAICGPKYTCNAAFRLTSCCSGKISAIGQYKVEKLRNRILLYARYGHSRWSKFWGQEVQISDQ